MMVGALRDWKLSYGDLVTEKCSQAPPGFDEKIAKEPVSED